MRVTCCKFILLLLIFSIAQQAAADPVISGLNRTDAPRSGRVAIEGTGFGTGGLVSIAGLNAWTSTWTDTRVVAYVPETAALGPASLHIISGGLQSNSEPLTVAARQASGRIKWDFEVDGDNMWWRPALAPDGTIYVHTNNETDGLVYAVTPDGGLKWVQKVNWYPYVPPMAGPDGAVYVGSILSIYRISPDGAIDWQFQGPSNITVSPTIGPDGRLYGAFEVLGAFAIDPLTGQLLWSNPGNPIITDKAGEAVETVFGPAGPGEPVDQFYISTDGSSGSFWAFSLDGEQLFNNSFGNIRKTAEVAIGSNGTIYGPTSLGLEVKAVDPSDGTTLWTYYPGASDWATGTNNVEIGPDDMLYFVGSSAKLEAFDPSTQTRKWQEFTPLDTLKRPSVTPDGSTLIATGADAGTFGSPPYVKAFNTQNGQELWRVNLPFQLNPGFRVYGVHHARITPDGATAYVSTMSLAEYPLNQDPHTFLYAIELDGGGGPPSDPCNYDGICTLGEDCENCPSDCPGNMSGKPSKRWCCGDGTCSSQEDSFICSLDCGLPAECGNFLCDPGEDACSCESDCGPPPDNEIAGWTCSDGFDNDCDGLTDCSDIDDCDPDASCALCLPGNESCTANDECCSGKCKRNGRCR